MGVGRHNLARLAEDAAGRTPEDHEALFFEGRWYTAGELHERTQRLSGGLVELGIEPGDRVVVLMANCPEVGLAYNALWRAGAAIAPAIFLLPPDMVRHILENSGARAIITTPEFLPNVRIAAEGLESVKWIVSAGPEEDGVLSLASLEEAEPAPIVPREDDDLAALMYTGGTTGRSKGVMLSHENLYAGAAGSHALTNRPDLHKTIVPLPLSHGFGLHVTIVGLLQEEPGRQAWLMRWFDAEPWISLVEEHRIERGVVVPSMLQYLLTQPLEEHDLSSLRFLNCGASPLPVEVAREFERRVPSVQINEGYGLTESGVVMSVNPPGERKLGSVGKVMPGYEVRIVDDAANDVPVGETGEVICRGSPIMQGYWGSHEGTAYALREGWLYTGDIGRIDEDGYLWIVDRKKDLIIRGGFNVYPRDVEDALCEHPAVALAGVVGNPDRDKGEEVVAFVQLDPGAESTPEELIEFTKGKVGPKSYPREIRIGQVPLTPVGKVNRKQLRSLL